MVSSIDVTAMSSVSSPNASIDFTCNKHSFPTPTAIPDIHNIIAGDINKRETPAKTPSVLLDVSVGETTPTSLFELMAQSPFATASTNSSPDASLDAEREYYLALRAAREQLASKLRETLRSLHDERALKSGLLRKRMQMHQKRGKNTSTTTPDNTNQSTRCDKSKSSIDPKTDKFTGNGNGKFSNDNNAGARNMAPKAPQPWQPPRNSQAIYAKQTTSAIAGEKCCVMLSEQKDDVASSVSRDVLYHDSMPMYSSPVSDECETIHHGTHETSAMEMVVRECRA